MNNPKHHCGTVLESAKTWDWYCPKCNREYGDMEIHDEDEKGEKVGKALDKEDKVLEVEEYLYGSKQFFWNTIKSISEWKPTVSAYTTVFNCISKDYPFLKSIKSMMSFADEVVVVDGGSDDGTYMELKEWAEKEPKLKVYQVKRDWDHPRFAVFDGQQKAESRARCSMEFCFQFDVDELVKAEDAEKFRKVFEFFPHNVDLLALPVVEYWGSSYEKVRVDVNPWKWRCSRNKKSITHGIPKELRKEDENGNLYAAEGTDGCDYIDVESGERIPFASFYTAEADMVRRLALTRQDPRSEEALKAYETWMNQVAENYPTIYHFSWVDIKRKIENYRIFWSDFWVSLYGKEIEDTAENNMMFDKPWSEVSRAEVNELAERLEKEMGGWIFHQKIDWERPTPSVKLNSPMKLEDVDVEDLKEKTDT